MKSISFAAVSGLALFYSLAAAVALPQSDVRSILSRMSTVRSVNDQTKDELAQILSSGTEIFDPSDPGWAEETERYLQQVKPNVQLSVRPGEEADVAKIVKYSNEHDINFYAVNRGHALTTDVAKFTGIEIDMRSLNKLSINQGNKTATIQGGVRSLEAITELWDDGYTTATGTCSCVSVIGPALGGGHGLQQGRHGLTSDHFVNLNVVLADGTTIQVNETSHPDLWWAMRGAGHNFGIVTSFESLIWEDDFKKYFVKTYQFPGSKLDMLVEEVNRFQKKGDLDESHWLGDFGLYFVNPQISETEATILWLFIYDGAQEDAEAELQPFDDLEPLVADGILVPYKEINDHIGTGINGALCVPNKTHVIGTAGLVEYNVTAMHAMYDLYNEKIGDHPELATAIILLEGYAMKGVKEQDPDASAFPFRDDNIVIYFDIRFDTPNDPLFAIGTEWRKQTEAILNAGQPTRKPTTYVNYAAGGESLEERYGHEAWRLEKLKQLKEKYDPENRFAWYNPIVPPVS